MKFSYREINKLPVAIIDNFYDVKAQQKIMDELQFLNNDSRKLRPPEETGSAYDTNSRGEKHYLKKNKAIGLDSIYGDRSVSNILTENRKLFSTKVVDSLINLHPLFRYVKFATADSTLVSYYENSDYYKKHHDTAVITAITWFYKKPKSFEGGNLILEDDLKIDCIPNRCVVFPSCTFHSVEKIRMKADITRENSGRFAISQFLYFNF